MKQPRAVFSGAGLQFVKAAMPKINVYGSTIS